MLQLLQLLLLLLQLLLLLLLLPIVGIAIPGCVNRPSEGSQESYRDKVQTWPIRNFCSRRPKIKEVLSEI